jgi:hypothetical protein
VVCADDILFVVMPWANAVLDATKVNATADTQYSAVLGTLVMKSLLLAARNAGSVVAGFNDFG